MLVVASVVVVTLVCGYPVLVCGCAVPPDDMAGTWYGAGTAGIADSSGGQTMVIETYLDLKQDFATISGTGALCSPANGTARIVPFTVTGKVQSYALTMTWTSTAPGTPPGQGVLPVKGSLANGTLTLTSGTGDGSFTATLAHGVYGAFATACSGRR